MHIRASSGFTTAGGSISLKERIWKRMLLSCLHFFIKAAALKVRKKKLFLSTILKGTDLLNVVQKQLLLHAPRPYPAWDKYLRKQMTAKRSCLGT